jgi:hypothetical protein
VLERENYKVQKPKLKRVQEESEDSERVLKKRKVKRVQEESEDSERNLKKRKAKEVVEESEDSERVLKKRKVKKILQESSDSVVIPKKYKRSITPSSGSSNSSVVEMRHLPPRKEHSYSKSQFDEKAHFKYLKDKKTK